MILEKIQSKHCSVVCGSWTNDWVFQKLLLRYRFESHEKSHEYFTLWTSSERSPNQHLIRLTVYSFTFIDVILKASFSVYCSKHLCYAWLWDYFIWLWYLRKRSFSFVSVLVIAFTFIRINGNYRFSSTKYKIKISHC